MGNAPQQSALERVAASVDVDRVFSALPGTFLGVLAASPDADGAFDLYLAFLKREPGLTAKALKVANTSFFGGRRSVESLHAALVRLGTASTRNIILSVGVMQLLDGQYGLLRHTLACAAMSARLAEAAGLDNSETYFTAGMLHDVGKVLLAGSAQGRNQHPDEPPLKGEDGVARERWLYGVNHTEIGGWFARQWDLPDSLVETIERHHDGLDGLSPITRVVSWANAWTRPFYEMDFAHRIDPEVMFDWAQTDLGLSREAFLRVCGAMAQDLDGLTEHMKTPPVTTGDVVRMLTEANTLLGAAAVEAAGMQRRTREQVRRLSLLHEFAIETGTCIGRRAVCEKAVQLIAARLGFGVVSILVPNAQGQLYVQAAVGLPADIVGDPACASNGEVGRYVFENEVPLLVQDLDRHESMRPSPFAGRYATNGFLSVPLIHGEQTYGVLNVNNKPGGAAFDLDDQHIFSTLGRNLAALLHAEEERQRRESADQRFRILAANSPVALAGFDMQGTIWLWNRAAQKLTGIANTEALGRPVPSAILPGGDDGVLTLWQESCRAGNPIAHQSGVIRAAGGAVQHVRYSVFPLEGKALAVWTAVNVTDEVKAQVRAEQRTAEIHATRQILERMLDDLDEEKMLAVCVENTAAAVEAQRSMLLLRTDGGYLCRSQAGFDEAFLTDERNLRGLAELALDALEEDRAVAANMPNAASDVSRHVIETGLVKPFAAAPLRFGKKNVGALIVCGKKHGVFDASALRILCDMANVTGVALHVAHEHATRLREAKSRTVAGMAVTYNHNVNNALQVIQGAIDYADTQPGDPERMRGVLKEISEAALEIARVNARLAETLRPAFRPYPGGGTLIDTPPDGRS